MKNCKYLLLLCFMGTMLTARGQYNINQNKIWAMGNGAGLDFSTNPPTIISTAIQSNEGCASINDASGLLFYTNGTSVWNALGAIMPDGDTIIPLNTVFEGTVSTSQSSVIVPVQGSDSRYYLFSLTDEGVYSGKLYCNIVDMNLDNGNGNIDLSYPLHNVIIEDSLSEKMIAIRGCKNNVWLLVHRAMGPYFLAYEITATGLNTTPVISTAGSNSVYPCGLGVMKASPDGRKIAFCEYQSQTGFGLQLFDFDFTTGMVSNRVILDSASTSYGCAFSPNGTKLYSMAGAWGLYQYNLNDPHPGQSKFLLGYFLPDDLKLAIDNKIYFISSAVSGSGQYLGRIEYPDNLGAACNFHDSVIHFTSGAIVTSGFPNEVAIAGVLPPNGLNRLVLDTVICQMPASGILLSAATGFSSYVWDNGTAGLSRAVYQTGMYYVHYETTCGTRTDTFRITKDVLDLHIIFNQPQLGTTHHYESYQWFKEASAVTGATDSVFTATGNGWYAVVVTDSLGCKDSVSYEVTGFTGIADPSPLRDQVTVYPNPARDQVRIKAPVPVSLQLFSPEGKWLAAPDGNVVSLKGYGNGLYLLHISDKDGNLIKVEKIIKME